MNKKIIFAHPRHLYSSYTDYLELVKLAGFQTCFQDEIDLETDAVYVVSPLNRTFGVWAHTQAPAGSRRAKVIWWNLERPDVSTVPVLDLPENAVHASVESVSNFFDAIWISDRYVASLDSKFTWVVLGSDQRLAWGGRMQLTHDLCHMCYIWGRREILNRIATRWNIAPASWGAERDVALRSSRAIVNIHQTPAPVQEPLRIALAAAYRLPLITETIKDPAPLDCDGHMTMIDYNNLEDGLSRWLDAPDARQKLIARGEALHQALCVDRTFGECVRRGVDDMLCRK